MENTTNAEILYERIKFMNHLNNIQNDFFTKLKQIQDEVVNVKLCSINSEMEGVLNEVTYETIYKIMELLDGYNTKKYQYSIIEKSSGDMINSDIQLHDVCADYLKSE